MTTGRHSQIFQQLRQAVLAHDGAGLTDADLLSCFVGQRDGAALEALIRRHSSMVWSVCRRVLSNEQDAEDAFQASFLVLVRKASSIRPREQVGAWLHGVAYRTALKARTMDARRRAKERRAAEMVQPEAEADSDWSDLLPVLDQELNRLPDKYRAALVMCELEGRPRKEAARQLGIPEGTLSSRLATGRRMLAKRLGRPGLALSAGAIAASVAVSPTLLASTVKAVAAVAVDGVVVAGVVSVRVAALAEGVIKAMLLTRISAGVILFAVVAVLAAGTGTAVYSEQAAPPDPKRSTPPAAALQHKEKDKDKEEEKKEDSAWGEARDGVQARIRSPKLVWALNEAPTFPLDLRNQGKSTPNARRVPYDCQIEVDKVWYSYDLPSGPYPAQGDLLKPGEEIDDWTIVEPDKNWGSFPGKARHFPLPPGKHTVRIAYTLSYANGDKPIRPISGPLEIEVSEKVADAGAPDGAKAPTEKTAPPAGADDRPKPVHGVVNVLNKLGEPITYELAIDTTLDKALDELLTRNDVPWWVNTPAFVKQGNDANVVLKAPLEKIEKVEGFTRKRILELLLSKIEAKSEDGQAVAVARPDGIEITTRRAYLDEFFPGRKESYLPPLVYAEFDKVPLSEALAQLQQSSGSNVVLAGYLGKEGETKVTADLHSVPLDAAVMILADMADLKLVRLGNVYYVTTRERARLLEKEEQERRLQEEKGKEEPAKPPANKTDAKK